MEFHLNSVRLRAWVDFACRKRTQTELFSSQLAKAGTVYPAHALWISVGKKNPGRVAATRV